MKLDEFIRLETWATLNSRKIYNFLTNYIKQREL